MPPESTEPVLAIHEFQFPGSGYLDVLGSAAKGRRADPIHASAQVPGSSEARTTALAGRTRRRLAANPVPSVRSLRTDSRSRVHPFGTPVERRARLAAAADRAKEYNGYEAENLADLQEGRIRVFEHRQGRHVEERVVSITEVHSRQLPTAVRTARTTASRPPAPRSR